MYKMLLNLDLNYLRTDKNILPTVQHNDVVPNHRSDDDNNGIEWNKKAVIALHEIMDIINNTKLMEPIGYIVQKYIDNNYNNLNFDNYTINTKNERKKVKDEIKMLAYVCETYMIKRKWTKANSEKIVYNAFSRIIHNVITNIPMYNIKDLQYTELHTVRLVNEIIVKHPTMYTQQIIISVYFLTRYLIDVETENNNLFGFMDTLILKTQDLDITILTPRQKREIMETLKTKRKLYLRIFLVLSYHMIREKSAIDTLWYGVKFKIKNSMDMINLIEDVMMETLICLVANEIGYDNDSFSISGDDI